MFYFHIFLATFLVHGVAPTPTKCGFGAFNVSGSSTVFPVSEAWATIYKNSCPNPAVKAESTSSGAGVRAGCNGTAVEVINLSRNWGVHEATKDGNVYTCKGSATTKSFTEVPVAIDALPIVIERRPDSTSADCINRLGGGITVKQLQWMYSNLTLEITEDIPFNDGNPATRKWSELNNTCKDEEIIIVGPPSKAGTNAYFREVMFTSTSPRESFRAGYTTFTDNSPQLCVTIF